MQSASAAQVVLQAVGPQMYGVQGTVTGAGHAPAPLQFAACVSIPALQLAKRQELAGYAQAAGFTPLQAPPQPEPSVAHAARPPTGAPLMVWQVPGVIAFHDSHCALQARLQHLPPTQRPLEQTRFSLQ